MRGERYELMRLIIQGKVQGKRSIGRRQNSWLKDIGRWFGCTSVDIFRMAVSKTMLAIWIANLRKETAPRRHKNKNANNRLRICQKAMKRAMLKISLRDKIRNELIRKRTGVADVVERASRQKWQWAGHVARSNTKWTKVLMQ
ncbi:uncharacterized protein LOC112464852 [Temnothorax curvispinosus]|uniref:Uncharacterized protein LOC112464852 n=1 Tax=Temnothorax curvispinosus TaxID=300111 RepID=A0A6J1QZT5_9HYME|nr:uncharacterized protein LOC112464852 [Temnothorax curvispinosus]